MSEKKKRILVVEDQRIIAADLENTLKKLGYEVVGSSSEGQDAVTLAVALKPDLVLMDIRLRGAMDGVQASAEIRVRCDIPVVFLTAYADEETIMRAKGTAPYGYIVKPFNERELHAAIDVAIYRHETERLLAAERARREAAEEFKLLVDGVKDYAIFLLDKEGRVTTWNEGAKRIEGYGTEEILGRHFSIFYPAEAAENGQPEILLRQALRDGRAESEGWRLRKDGSRFWANVLLTPILGLEGKLHGFGAVAKDLTEKKRREEMNSILDRASLALAASLDPSATFKALARVLIPQFAHGFLIDLVQEEEQLVQNVSAHIDPQTAAWVEDYNHKVVEERGLEQGALYTFLSGKVAVHPSVQMEALRTESKENEVVGAATIASPDPPGFGEQMVDVQIPERFRALSAQAFLCVPIRVHQQTVGVMNILRSTTGSRFTAQEIAFAEELSWRIGLAVDNARLYREAQEAIRAREEFLMIASHELKTPLTPLQIQLDTLARALEKEGVRNERLSEKLVVATRQTTRLNRLVESLLDVSRITAGKVTLEIEHFDLAELVNDVGIRFREEALRAGSQLVVNADGPINGRWDRLRLEQVLSNLLSNAIKYGLGRPIELAVEEKSGTACISVVDHGMGIEQGALKRIFGRFERAVSMQNFGGLGLGLFIARQLVEAHGGTIVAQSRFGAGSTFAVVMPLESSPHGAAVGTSEVQA